MVDELELLKKDWQKQEKALPHFSKTELYPMLLKKSSSVVKWILIVSLLEFGVWLLLSFGMRSNGDHATEVENAIGTQVELGATLVHLFALTLFLGWFFKNYRKIQNTDSPSVLIKNIINTRKTVKYYIWFNLIFLVVATLGAFALIEVNAPEVLQKASMGATLLVLLLFLGIAVGTLFLFYKLLYGRLLKKLTANYEELKKLEL